MLNSLFLCRCHRLAEQRNRSGDNATWEGIEVARRRSDGRGRKRWGERWQNRGAVCGWLSCCLWRRSAPNNEACEMSLLSFGPASPHKHTSSPILHVSPLTNFERPPSFSLFCSVCWGPHALGSLFWSLRRCCRTVDDPVVGVYRIPCQLNTSLPGSVISRHGCWHELSDQPGQQHCRATPWHLRWDRGSRPWARLPRSRGMLNATSNW